MPFVPPETFTSGQILTASSMNDISGNLSYLKAIGNIKSTTVNTVESVTSTSLVQIPNMSVSITPLFSNSKILVTCHLQVGETGDDIPFVAYRGATAIGVGTTAATLNCSFYLRGDSEESSNLSVVSKSWQFLDDGPGNTSATTYSIHSRVRVGGQTLFLNRAGANNNFVTASTLTVQEVPQ